MATIEKPREHHAIRSEWPALGQKRDWWLMPVHEIMQRSIACIHPDVRVQTACSWFVEGDVRAAAVVDSDGHPMGVVCSTDLLRGMASEPAELRVLSKSRAPDGSGLYELDDGFHIEQASGRTVGDIMTPFAFALPQAATLQRALSLMEYEGVRRLVVVDDHGKVAGMLDAFDVVGWLAHRLGRPLPLASLLDPLAAASMI